MPNDCEQPISKSRPCSAGPALRFIRLGCILLVAALIGCSSERPAERAGTKNAEAKGEVRLLVVDDSPIAKAVESLASEWKARGGATIVLREATSEALLAEPSAAADADAIIYPSGLLGELAERKLIAPLPSDYAKSELVDWSDTFELLQLAETRWGQTPYALPFGSPPLTCFYRADLLERAHKQPPRTWREYQELAEFFAQRENLDYAAPSADAAWHGTIEPLAPTWAGRLLLARAAAYARHRDHFSTLFKIDTMEPLIAGPAFVRALEELCAAAKLGGADARRDPMAVRKEFLAGRAALALSWPTHNDVADEAGKDRAPLAIGFSELPGADEVYNYATRSWSKRGEADGTRVTTLGLAGRLGSVTEQAARPAEVMQLLAWLSGAQWGGTVSSASAHTALYRTSQLREPGVWLGAPSEKAAGPAYATAVQGALSRPVSLSTPRIPGDARYLAALDDAVLKAVAGELSPTVALTATAARWAEITAELGQDRQRAAYRQSLGLEP